MTTEAISRADQLEAKARRIMANPHPARGWDSGRKRAVWLADIDDLLDEWLLAQ